MLYAILYREQISYEEGQPVTRRHGLVTLAQRAEVGPIHVWASEDND